jgi:predicted transposase YbfD/YdcC
MKNTIPHTIFLQDGTAFNINKRIAKQAVPLKSFLAEVPDPRKHHGKRHSLLLILLIIFVALLRGSKDLKDACLFARINQKLFKRMGLPLPHGVPDPTTISRVLAALDPEALVATFRQFLAILDVSFGDVWSFDGKTMRAVTGENVVRHILSFFSHGTHLTLGQIGVGGKENEIPAFERLLSQGDVRGKLLLGDALHTQRATATAIVAAEADYLLVVKGNQKGLRRAIQAELGTKRSNPEMSPKLGSYSYETTDRRRTITTTVTAMTAPSRDHELALPVANQHWAQVRTAGILHRTGTRTGKDGKVTPVDEMIGFITPV